MLALQWLLNPALLWYIISTDAIDFGSKLSTIFGGLADIFTNFDGSMQAVLSLLLSVGLGVNLTSLVYVLRSNARVAKSSVAVGGGSVVASVFAAGCAACGASIITPLIALTGATATSGLSRNIGFLASLLGLMLIAYSLYGLGSQAATIQAKLRNNQL